LLIPHQLSGKPYAFAGPFPSSHNFSEDVTSIFPLHITCEPKIFATPTFNMSFFEPGHRVFRSAPIVSEGYLQWLNKVEKQYASICRANGIFDLIQLSREGPKYHGEMILAALHFWENSTNTFHFKVGMMTPTLLDVAAITGLKPTGFTFDPKYKSNNFHFDFKILSFSGFLKTYFKPAVEEVSAEEHIAFLTYWLSHFVLCTCSYQVVKRLVPLAILLHEGSDVALGRFILASLYDSLGQGNDLLKKTEKGSQLSLSGPIWLLQLWLNATFASNFNLFLPSHLEASLANRQSEGARLALLRQREAGLTTRQLFFLYFKALLAFDEITPENTPFATRRKGPAWLTRPFPAVDPNDERETNNILSIILSPTVLSSRQGIDKKHLGLVGYQPNLVARQFGLTQFRPKSLFRNRDDIVLGNSGMSEVYYDQRLKLAEKITYNLTPMDFEISHFCSYEFAAWWSLYYEKYSKDEQQLLRGLNAGFDALQSKASKSKGNWNIRRINISIHFDKLMILHFTLILILICFNVGTPVINKAKETSASTASAATPQKSLPNTGAKV
jgi:hypothetical protein